MIKEAIVTAPTIEEAQAKAVAELNAPASADVSFEVIEVPSKKLLGLFGGSPAKVRAYYELPDPPKPAPKPAKKPAQKPVQKAVQKPVHNTPQEKKAAPEPKSILPAKTEGKEIEVPAVTAYLSRIFTELGVDDAVFKFIEDEDNSMRIYAESQQKTGNLIGKRGETLDALQTIARMFINKEVKRYAHITLDIGDYRAKRAEQLVRVAKKTAERVIRTGRNTALEPMTPYERRIIHTTIGEIEGVESHSVGFDDNRKVLITQLGKFEERPQRGAYGGGGRGGYNNRGGDRGGRFERRERPAPYKPQGEARLPKTDAGAAALYGKVEVPKKED
ncbi:MAG: Jag N-terminal domain-containing protein [Oscillospiraceae bacterium]|nr:Jag N-terminal domain-containing protein [Oscillospiraceae bacterium]